MSCALDLHMLALALPEGHSTCHALKKTGTPCTRKIDIDYADECLCWQHGRMNLDSFKKMVPRAELNEVTTLGIEKAIVVYGHSSFRTDADAVPLSYLGVKVYSYVEFDQSISTSANIRFLKKLNSGKKGDFVPKYIRDKEQAIKHNVLMNAHSTPNMRISRGGGDEDHHKGIYSWDFRREKGQRVVRRFEWGDDEREKRIYLKDIIEEYKDKYKCFIFLGCQGNRGATQHKSTPENTISVVRLKEERAANPSDDEEEERSSDSSEYDSDNTFVSYCKRQDAKKKG